MLRLFSLAALGVGCCLAQEKQTKEAEPAKENEKPKESQNSTPLPQKNSLKQLEEDLFRPLKTFSPSSSLDGVFTPPRSAPPRPVEDKKAREKRERDKDWVFMNPDDFMAQPTMEEIFNLPGKDKDGKDQKKLSPMERYYQRSAHWDDARDSHEKSGSKNPNEPRKPGAMTETDSQDDDSGLSPGLRESERKLKVLSGIDRLKQDKADKADAAGRNFFTDIFGLGKGMPTIAETEAKRKQKERMDDFKQLLGMPVTPSPGDSLDPLVGLRKPPSTALAIPSVSPTGIAPPPAKTPGTASQLGTIGGFSGSFASPFAPGGALAPQPVLEQPKPRTVQQSPSFNAPRRTF